MTLISRSDTVKEKNTADQGPTVLTDIDQDANLTAASSLETRGERVPLPNQCPPAAGSVDAQRSKDH